MLEPQSTALFILLMVVFCALLVGVAVAKQAAVRVLAASLAFVPAMLFGVAAVNKYYGYYQTWAQQPLTSAPRASAPYRRYRPAPPGSSLRRSSAR